MHLNIGTPTATYLIQEVHMKLIAGQQNVLYTILKIGYAEGSNKPKRIKVRQSKPVVTKLRKQEGLII